MDEDMEAALAEGGEFHGDPLGLALRRFNFYQCHQCSVSSFSLFSLSLSLSECVRARV